MHWIILDCRRKGIERLSIVDRDTERVICRVENTVSGRPIEQDDLDHAELIVSAPDLQVRVAELKETLNEVMPWVSNPKMQDRITEILNR